MQTMMHRKNGTADTTADFSPAIWANCPIVGIRNGTVRGWVIEDDFTELQSEDGTDDVYQKYIDTSNTIRLIATSTSVYGGVVRLLTDATDNDAPVLQRRGANAGATGHGPAIIGNTAGSAFPLWFECRIKKSSITDNQCAFFAGLAQCTALAADDGLLEDDTGDVVNSISVIGFRAKHDNGEELDFVYQDSGQTAPTETIANITAMVADTYIKLGFVYWPPADASQKISIYVNNQVQGTYVTTTNIDATTFPENDALCVVFGSKNGEATACNFDIDWFRLAQVYDWQFGAR